MVLPALVEVEPTWLWKAAISAFVFAIAFGDLWKRTIPRSLTVAAAVAGLAYHAWFGGLEGSLAAGVAGLLLGLLLFALRGIGGGDAKLIAALGTLLGWALWTRALAAAILCAAAIGLIRALASGRLTELLRNLLELTGWLASRREAHPVLQTGNPGMIRSPFAVAVALGTLLSLWSTWQLW